MLRTTLAALSLAVALPAVAQEGFSYDYISAAYTRVSPDQGGTDDGFGVGLSVAIAENYHLFGAYAGLDAGQSVDATSWTAGVGFNTPIAEKMDVVVRLFYVSTEFDTPIATVDNNGYGVSGFVRARASEWIELNAGLSYVDTDLGNDIVLEAGFWFTLSDSVDIGLSGSWPDDGKALSLSGRIYF